MVKQKIQLQHHERFFECPQCIEPISNPLCHNCLRKEIESWLSFYPKVKKKMAFKIKKYAQEVDNLVIDAVNCVSCKEKKAALCPYCFIEGVFNLFKKSEVDKRILNDFTHIFNFDTEHAGYAKEVEEQIKAKKFK